MSGEFGAAGSGLLLGESTSRQRAERDHSANRVLCSDRVQPTMAIRGDRRITDVLVTGGLAVKAVQECVDQNVAFGLTPACRAIPGCAGQPNRPGCAG